MSGIKRISLARKPYGMLSSFIIFTFIVIILNLLWGSTFESNDDAGIMKTFSGYALGEPTYLHTYASLIIGYIISSLYSIFPQIPWYAIYSFTILIVCGTIILNFFLIKFKGLKPKYKSYIITTVVCSLLIWPIINISYTVNAGLCGTASIILMADAIKCKNSKNFSRLIIFSFMMLYLCSLIRYSSFKAVLPYYFITYIFLLCLEKENRNTYKYILFLCAIVGLIVGYNLFEKNYKVKNELESYREYEAYRGVFSDYNCLSYDDDPQLYENIGWDRELYMMAKGWYYFDERFNKESLKTIVEKSNIEYNKSINFINTIYLMCLSIITNKLELSIILLIFIIGIPLQIKVLKNKAKINKIYIYYIVGVIILFFGELFYLCWRGRFILRAFLCSALPATISIFISLGNPFISKTNNINKKGYYNFFILILGVFIILLSLTFCFNYTELSSKKYLNNVSKKVEEYCSKYPDKFYIYDGTLVDDTRLTTGTNGIIGYNRQFWGGSTAFNAQYYHKIRKNGFEEFTTSDFFHEDVYLLSRFSNLISETEFGHYLQKNYENVQAVVMDVLVNEKEPIVYVYKIKNSEEKFEK